jgi:serine/threonine protein kinase
LVRALHQAGQTHRAIGPDLVTVEDRLRPHLARPPASRRFGGEHGDPQFCPPELIGAEGLDLPADIETAAALLTRQGHAIRPERIDVYQLGALLCLLLSGEGVLSYMYSPTAKAAVPSSARPLVDRALGHSPEERMAECDPWIAALDALIAEVDPELPAVELRPTPAHGGGQDQTSDTVPAAPPRDASPPGAGQVADDLPFQRLGPYRVLSRIGGGGMGDVYQGYDDSLNRPLAIKVLPPGLARHEHSVRRFQAEAAAAARVDHPNVVPIHYIGQHDEHSFFAMQYVEGESLADRLRRRGRLPMDESLDIVEQSLLGLAAAHAQGLIHRDVKPGNILLDHATGQAVLVDFGLARTVDDEAHLTATGTIIGTVEYIAPEQARGLPVDFRADVYALGVLWYQLLAGRLPFEADGPMSMIFQHLYEDPYPLDAAAPEVPEALRKIVLRMMAKSPDERYPSCEAVLDDVQAFRRGGAETAVAPGRRWLLPAGIAGAAAVLAGLLLLAPSDREALRSTRPKSLRVPQGAIALLTFEDDTVVPGSGQSFIQDLSGSGNHFRGPDRPTIVRGKVGSGLSLKGCSPELPRALLSGKGEYTIAAWVHVAKPGELFRIYSEQAEQSSAPGRETILRIDVAPEARVDVYARSRKTEAGWTAARTPEDSVQAGWNFIAVRLRSGSAEAGNLTVRVNASSYASALHGVDHPQACRSQLGPANGSIDEVGVFDRALSDEEIQTLYEMGADGRGMTNDE